MNSIGMEKPTDLLLSIILSLEIGYLIKKKVGGTEVLRT